MSGRAYAGRSPDERRAARRQALLAAGLEHFGTQGFRSTTIEDLCRTARVGRQSFYEHFDSREALLGEVFSRTFAGILRQIDDRLAELPLDDVAARASAAMRVVTDALLLDPRQGRIATVEVAGVPQLAELGTGVIHALADRLTAEANLLAGHGLLPDRDHSILAIAAVGGIREVVVDHLRSDAPPPIDRVADDLAAMITALGSA